MSRLQRDAGNQAVRTLFDDVATPKGNAVSEIVNRGTAGSARPLPHLTAIQAAFGRHNVTGASAHIGPEAAAANEAFGAMAFTAGNHVVFGRPPTLRTAAHEAAHLVQQHRVPLRAKDTIGPSHDAYEREAEAVADRTVQGKSVERLLDRSTGAARSGLARLVQCQPQKTGSTKTPAYAYHWEPSPGTAYPMPKPASTYLTTVTAADGHDLAKEHHIPTLGETVLDVITDFVPIVSNIKDAIIAITGVNPITGEEVGIFGRIVAGLFAIPVLGNVAKYLTKGGKLVFTVLAKVLTWIAGKLRKPIIAATEWTAATAVAIWKKLVSRFGKGSKTVPIESKTPIIKLPEQRTLQETKFETPPEKQLGKSEASPEHRGKKQKPSDLRRKAPASSAGKHPYWLPSFSKVEVKWEKIFEAHTVSGSRVEQGKEGGVFGYNWSQQKIKNAVREAYDNSTPVKVQLERVRREERVLLEGTGGGEVIHMWFNKTTKVLETAYPIVR